MIYEIRNYYFNKDLFEEYKKWIQRPALPYLKKNLDVVGFWVGTDIESEILGDRMDKLGSSNVTWIIRWDSMDQRNMTIPEVLYSPEWERIFSTVPGGEASYFRAELKFMQIL
mgnify:FL=1